MIRIYKLLILLLLCVTMSCAEQNVQTVKPAFDIPIINVPIRIVNSINWKTYEEYLQTEPDTCMFLYFNSPIYDGANVLMDRTLSYSEVIKIVNNNFFAIRFNIELDDIEALEEMFLIKNFPAILLTPPHDGTIIRIEKVILPQDLIDRIHKHTNPKDGILHNCGSN